jgi:hypothetical protein
MAPIGISYAQQPALAKTITENDLNKIKVYAKIADMYKRLSIFHEQIGDIHVLIGHSAMELSYYQERYLTNILLPETLLEGLNPIHASIQKDVNKITQEAAKYGLNVSNMNVFMSQYSKALVLEKESINKLYVLYATPTDQNKKVFWDISNKAWDTSFNAKLAADKSYTEYLNKILQY